jgi:HAAS
MGERSPARDAYLHGIAPLLTGSRRARRRFLRELGDHLDDAIAADLDAGASAGEVERRALARLGSPASIARAWDERCSRLRVRRRRRASLLAAAAAAATVLAVTQHADGRRDQAPPAGACAARPVASAPACGVAAR